MNLKSEEKIQLVFCFNYFSRNVFWNYSNSKTLAIPTSMIRFSQKIIYLRKNYFQFSLSTKVLFLYIFSNLNCWKCTYSIQYCLLVPTYFVFFFFMLFPCIDIILKSYLIWYAVSHNPSKEKTKIYMQNGYLGKSSSLCLSVYLHNSI